MKPTLDELLENIQVEDPGRWENDLSCLMPEWYAVSTGEKGIIAYFSNEDDAYRFRLSEINRILND